ncbi:MAG: tetratricopeptide repeat protein [Candidatus Aureabacteria bacterium]|nr:tetratricopeptide repeat protein [Candidatus Auribacterota bacterium]
MKKDRDVKELFQNITLKQVIWGAGFVFLAAFLAFFVRFYQAEKQKEFSLRISQAETVEDFKSILQERCPGELRPEAEYFYAKALFEGGDFQQAFSTWESFINAHPDHFLFGRAVIGYIHSGIHLKKGGDFLDDALKRIEAKDFAWKNEALYDMAMYYEDIRLGQKAVDIYRRIIQSGDPYWKSMAEFRLAERQEFLADN